MLELDSFQRAAVTSLSHDLSIVAPAGSGKTRVLVERVRWLIEQQHVRPERILVLTFAKRAALELGERLRARGCSNVQAQTFHAWAYKKVRTSHLWPGRLVLDAERTQLLRRLVIELLRGSEHGIVARDFCEEHNWSEPFFVRQLVQTIETLRQAGIAMSDPRLLKASAGDPLAMCVYAAGSRFEQLLTSRGSADFSALVSRALELSGPSRFAVQPEHVLVDEVQDANHQELALVARACRAGHCTWVGDPHQSLYGWRGAAGKVPRLSQTCELVWNYRSTPEVLDAVNRFADTSIRATRSKSGDRPHLIHYPRYAEARLVLKLVGELLQQGFKQQDILCLARAHAVLEQLSAVRKKFGNVRIATVHAVKGLESRVVIVIGASEGRFGFPIAARGETLPLVRQLASFDKDQEERNVFYVALTRARDRLVVCVPVGSASPFTQNFTKDIVQRATLPETN